jgi:putative ABC transport system permease protein
LIIGLIIVLSISNMLIMNVMERTGEIGTLLAIGLKRKKILQMFATEGFLLGLVGGLAGIAIGYALAELISSIGIPMPPPPGMEEGYTGEIRVTAGLLISAFLIASITTLLAGLYPAWKASRQQIVNALRHNI